MSQGDVEARVVADTSGLQAGMVQAAVVTEAQMKRIAQYVKAANDTTANLGKTAASAAVSTSSAYKQIADGAEKVRAGHAGVNRELLVLTHELSQGNFSRFGGSMLVLAERTNALEFAMTGAGAATLGIGAALVGTLALMAKGAIDADKFAKSLQLTGNYAAVTTDQLKLMAGAQALQTGQTAGGARGSLEAVAGSGLFGPSQVAVAARAMGDYQRLTGETAADALKKFQSIQDGVAKWAAEENKSVHFLTLAEYEHIKALEDSGDKEGAAIAAMTAYATTIEGRAAPSLGLLARAYHAIADAASSAGQAIMDIGRPVDATTASLAAIDRQIALVKQANTGNPAAAADYLSGLSDERARVAKLAFEENERRSMVATNAAIQQAAIAGKAYEEDILRQAHAMSERTKELDKWKARQAADKAAGVPMSDADYSSGVAEINKKYNRQPGDAQANEYRTLEATIKAFNATTDEEISRMGKLTDGQKFSIQAHEELTRAGKKLSDQQRATIASAIDEAAAHRTVADMLLVAQKATIARVQADTANQEQQQRSVESVIQAGNDQANAVLRQSQMIGKSADEVLKIQELQKFDDLVGKALLGADNDTVARINKVAAVIRGNLVDSIDAAKKAQDDFNASFSNGWNKAQQDFTKQAGNSAAYGEKVYNDFATNATDDITKFAEGSKVSIDGLVKTIIDDLIKMEVQKGFAALTNFGNGSSGWFTALAAAFSSDGSSGGVSAGSGVASAAGFANGLDYVPYDGMPAILHEGERVTSRQDAAVERSGRGGVSIHIDQSGASYGAGVDVAGVQAIARAQAERAKGEIYRQLNTGTRR